MSPRPLLALVFTTTLISIMGNSLLAPAIPDILATFDRPDSAGGLLIAATSLPGIVMAPVIGVLADRFGRRAVLTPCLLVFGVAGIAVATAPTFQAMLAARFALGVGAAGLVNLAVVLVSDHYAGVERTRWIGANSGVLTLALAVFPLVSGVITDLVGWRWALAPQSLGVLAAVAAWRILESGRPAEPVRLRDQLAGATRALRDPTIARSVIGAAVAFAILFGVFLAALPTHLEAEFGLSAGWRGLVLGLPAATSSLIAFNLGNIRHRVGARPLLVASAAVWTVAFVLVGTAAVIGVLLVGTLLHGVGEGAMIPTLQDLAMQSAPDDQRAAVMAAWTGSARLGQTIGPLIAAAVLAGPGSTWAMLAGSAGAAGLLLLFGGAAVRSRLRPAR